MNLGITLAVPTPAHEAEALAYISECLAAGETHVNGSCAIEKFDYTGWLEHIGRIAAHDVPEGWVYGDQLFAMRASENRLVGMINNRYEPNESMEYSTGYIGYSVRPAERRKGYGSEMLRLALPYFWQKGFERVLITCDEGNAASAGVMIKNGGVYEKSVYDESCGVWRKRFWIEKR